MESLEEIKIQPTYIVGDFDSVDNNVLKQYANSNVKIKRLIPEKDFTDTESALELAISLNVNSITIIGGIGTRIDHTIANIHILKLALDKNIDVKIVDENNEIRLVNENMQIVKDNNYKYISFIPLTTEVTGITLKGFKYNLDNYTLKIGTSLGISNEQVENIATVNLEKGILIMIKSKD